jgi:hypothetical protein
MAKDDGKPRFSIGIDSSKLDAVGSHMKRALAAFGSSDDTQAAMAKLAELERRVRETATRDAIVSRRDISMAFERLSANEAVQRLKEAGVSDADICEAYERYVSMHSMHRPSFNPPSTGQGFTTQYRGTPTPPREIGDSPFAKYLRKFSEASKLVDEPPVSEADRASMREVQRVEGERRCAELGAELDRMELP